MELQDFHGANVLLLLFAGWAAVCGRIVDASDMRRAAAAIEPWYSEVVVPLRTLRRRLKSGPPPAPGPATDALRDSVKAAEIKAELIALDRLGNLAGRGAIADAQDAAQVNVGLALEAGMTARVSADLPSAARLFILELHHYRLGAGMPATSAVRHGAQTVIDPDSREEL